jgi:hypothetical protein
LFFVRLLLPLHFIRRSTITSKAQIGPSTAFYFPWKHDGDGIESPRFGKGGFA